MADATRKEIRDMHQRHHGNEKEEWIRNQLKRIYGKNNSQKLIVKALRALPQITQNLSN